MRPTHSAAVQPAGCILNVMAAFKLWPCLLPPSVNGAVALSERVQQMRLNSKWTWGLAWAGLAVVVAVPSADFLSGKAGNKAAVLTSTVDPVRPVKTAEVTTTVTPTGITIRPAGSAPAADPVSSYIKSNSSLPDYISDGAASSSVEPVKVATIEPTVPAMPPAPFPNRPPDIAAPVPSPAAQPSTAAVAPAEQPVIVDDNPAPTQQAAVNAPAGPVPPADIIDDTANWRTQGLERYLDQQGLLDGSTTSSRSTASVTVVNRSPSNYDPNGFYLSDGPNGSREQRRARIEQMLQDDALDDPGFTLF